MYFSKELYIQALKKVKSVGIGMTVTVLILNVMTALEKISFLSTAVCKTCNTIRSLGIAPATPIIMLFTFFMVSFGK